jgi:hypothetical protein
MRTLTLAAALFFSSGFAYGQSFLDDNFSIVGSYYRNPYGPGSVRLRPQPVPRQGYWQTMPGGYRVWNAPVRPTYHHYQGRYSPYPRVSTK